MITLQQQEEEIIKIRSEQEVPKCFGKEFHSKSNLCKKCFAYNKCQKFIRDFGYLKKLGNGKKKQEIITEE